MNPAEPTRSTRPRPPAPTSRSGPRGWPQTPTDHARRALTVVLHCPIVLLWASVLLCATVLSGCRTLSGAAQPADVGSTTIPVGGAAALVSYDHRASAVVLEFQLLPPYNPAYQATGFSLSVHGDGTFNYSGDRARSSGRISESQLQALLQQMWDDRLFAEPDLGERTYDAGEERLVATANSTRTELVLSSMSPSDNPSVAATRSAIRALLRATG